nr:hypothetical protein [Tanacetum cinerariifolium]
MGNNMVPLRFDTIQLVQNALSFHRIRSEDPNQHLKDFLKLVDSLDLESENGEECACVYFNFPFFFNVVAKHYVSPFTLFFLPFGERNGVYVLGDGEFSLFPYQYFFRSYAGRELFKKPEHFSHPIVDLLALLESGIFKSLHLFSVCCHVVPYSRLKSGS